MQKIDFESIENELLEFAKTEVIKFVEAHPGEVFYAFAFDCNAEYAEVNLCFNTEEAFTKTLTECQSGKYKDSYQTEEQIYDLRYNTGDWDYQCFSTKYVLSEDELFGDEDQDNEEENGDDEPNNELSDTLLLLFSKTLLEFIKTEEFKKIPKTAGFKVFCVDHNEDLEEAELRLSNLL
ncbi:hypothetical protein HDF26_001595 [Pedobacter cryoconitis]|uniref:DUF4303 domain-containing protein n=1 Tax=Pedobacter cryoconitis TaxID=188932 RepID=UPI00160AB7A6|nr:DUF4303 domain-containing protein [Pedobacter cryoconitis]MBB6271168.1 hypothetical protein [Pedobacter cryoconitis]